MIKVIEIPKMLRFTPVQQKHWLHSAFQAVSGELEITKQGHRNYTSVLNNIFNIQVYPSGMLQLLGYQFGRSFGTAFGLPRKNARAIPFVENDVTADKSITKFYKSIVDHLLASDGELTFCKFKDGQSKNILQPNQFYPLIFSYDKLHDHQSSHLIDFNDLFVDPYTMKIEELDFEYNHSHFLAPSNSS